MSIILALVLRSIPERHQRNLEVKRRIDQLTISQIIFILSTLVISIFLLISSVVIQRIFFVRMDGLIENTSKEINKQVIMNYEGYLGNVIETSNSLQAYVVGYTQENELGRLEDLFVSTTKSQPNIKNIALVSQDAQGIVKSSSKEWARELGLQQWFIDALRFKDIHHYSTPHLENVVIDGLNQVITISKTVDYYENGEKQTGVLVLDIGANELNTLAKQTNLGNKGHILITDINNDLVFDSSQACNLDESCAGIETVKSIILGGQLLVVDGLNMYVNVSTLQDTRWKITTFINVDESVKTKKDILISVIFIFILTMAFIALVSAWIARRITGPLTGLMKHIERLEKGDFEAQVQVSGQKEVVHLADAFNIMSNRIHELMMRIIDEQNEKRKTHFIALQNQINPHFLYNTLDSIVSLSEKGRNKDVEKAIVALSKFFRQSISNDMNLIPLKEEVEHVQNYLLIQQIRYRKDFEFTIDIPESLLDVKVIKLTLQPLVENAIIHGINIEQSFNQIHISAQQDNDFIYLEVYNQGFGMSPQKIQEIMDTMKSSQPSGSLGLKNVYQRLRLYYGSTADVVFESEMDAYTKVSLKIPRIQEEVS